MRAGGGDSSSSILQAYKSCSFITVSNNINEWRLGRFYRQQPEQYDFLTKFHGFSAWDNPGTRDAIFWIQYMVKNGATGPVI